MFFKPNFLKLAVGLSMAFAVVSCGDGDEEDYYYPVNPDPGPGSGSSVYLTATPDNLLFSADGESKTVTLSNVTGNVSYIASDWLTVYHEYGYVYTVKASANPSSEMRSGYINFKDSHSTDIVQVYQNRGEGQSGNPGGNSGGNPGGSTNKAPSAPTGLYASPDGPSTAPYAMLRWNSVSGATSYVIYRSTSSYGSYSKIGTSSYSSYSDESVKYGNTYYYKVKASNSYGTSDYSDYAMCEFTDRRKPGPVTYGNCTVSGTTMTLRWSAPRDPSYGTPTKAILRVRNPDSGVYADLQTLSGSATSVSFTYTPWVDKDGYIYAGIILENENGTGGGVPKIYDSKNRRWMN